VILFDEVEAPTGAAFLDQSHTRRVGPENPRGRFTLRAANPKNPKRIAMPGFNEGIVVVVGKERGIHEEDASLLFAEKLILPIENALVAASGGDC
jgi:hypothetical protein